MILEDYVVIDLEMTGLNPKIDKILELAAVRIRGGVETETFSKLVNPQVPISPRITELTGITAEEAAEGVPADAAIEAFLEFLGEDILVGQL